MWRARITYDPSNHVCHFWVQKNKFLFLVVFYLVTKQAENVFFSQIRDRRWSVMTGGSRLADNLVVHDTCHIVMFHDILNVC